MEEFYPQMAQISQIKNKERKNPPRQRV